MSADLWSYALLLLVGFLPNEIWRWLGVALKAPASFKEAPDVLAAHAERLKAALT